MGAGCIRVVRVVFGFRDLSSWGFRVLGFWGVGVLGCMLWCRVQGKSWFICFCFAAARSVSLGIP